MIKYRSRCNICNKIVMLDIPKLFTNCIKCKKAYLQKINKNNK